MNVTAEVLTGHGSCAAIAAGWDDLAVAARAPFCAPAWMLAWWSEAAPAGAELRVVAVRRDADLIGVAPMYVERDRLGVRRYRFLAAPASLRTHPVARPGDEDEVALAAAGALRSHGDPPDALFFDGVPVTSPWLGALGRHLSRERPPWSHDSLRLPAPAADLAAEGFDAWMRSKSRNFREGTRRHRRKLEAAGAVYRFSTSDTVAADVAAMARLHHARWEGRGGSRVMTPEVERMLVAAAPGLLGSGRFRLGVIDIDGRPISAHLFVAAGGEASYWLGGFDDGWGQHQPAMQVLIAAIEDAIGRGDTTLDLGGGGQAYKYRLASSQGEVTWRIVVPRGPRYVRARASYAPQQVRREILSRIPDDVKDRVKRALGRSISAKDR